jgi:hypothetical protein
MPLGFEAEDRDKVRGIDRGFVFGSLVNETEAQRLQKTVESGSRVHGLTSSQKEKQFLVHTGVKYR